jgi:hypothetical protein
MWKVATVRQFGPCVALCGLTRAEVRERSSWSATSRARLCAARGVRCHCSGLSEGSCVSRRKTCGSALIDDPRWLASGRLVFEGCRSLFPHSRFTLRHSLFASTTHELSSRPGARFCCATEWRDLRFADRKEPHASRSYTLTTEPHCALGFNDVIHRHSSFPSEKFLT